MTTEIDHLIIAADTLDAGVAWCEATLGVTPGPGGRHAFMGTHNRLLNLSGADHPRCYLEIIAIDPEAPPPGRPRWFGLDARPPGPPTLWHVVARSPGLLRQREALAALDQDPGEPTAASRASAHGLLTWQITLRADGTLGHAGALPTLIQWDGPHPADHLPASGLSLRSLVLRGPGPKIRDTLRLRGAEFRVEPGPALSARIDAPAGAVVLHSEAPASEATPTP